MFHPDLSEQELVGRVRAGLNRGGMSLGKVLGGRGQGRSRRGPGEAVTWPESTCAAGGSAAPGPGELGSFGAGRTVGRTVGRARSGHGQGTGRAPGHILGQKGPGARVQSVLAVGEEAEANPRGTWWKGLLWGGHSYSSKRHRPSERLLPSAIVCS